MPEVERRRWAAEACWRSTDVNSRADRDGANTINIATLHPLPRSDWGDLTGPISEEVVTAWRANDRFLRFDLTTLKPSTFMCVTFV